MEFLLCYLAVANAAGFAAMGMDKLLARRGARRIPERRLLSIAISGGAAGAMLGMLLFRHKTRHRKFAMGLPLLCLIEGATAAAIACRLA